MSTPAPVSSIEQRLANIEAALKKDASSVTTWIKTNVPHFVTWAGLAYAFIKHIV
jgi:hypothetical protein